MQSANAKRRVLVINQAQDAVEVLRRNLLSRGYEVLIATSVSEACAHLQTAPVNLILVDLSAVANDSTSQLNQLASANDSPAIVIITGYLMLKKAVRVARLCGGECLVKPFTETELFAAAQRALAKRPDN